MQLTFLGECLPISFLRQFATFSISSFAVIIGFCSGMLNFLQPKVSKI